MDKPRSLNLSIRSGSSEQLRKLLELALYELDRAVHGNSSLAWAAAEGEVISGAVEGTMGSYRFDYLLGTPELVECRKQLLDDGFKLATVRDLSFDYDLYEHPESKQKKRLYFDPVEIKDHEDQ
ncbi:hypothetical protein [Pseudomonas sp. Gutcm_11s]|uniref:hypothetical protein n=1 Tax=Pseudomonas sp. Gutcm_11s TaxID=3026088 RepID=UPI002363170B|nr:hypothetical protein [Pseudomonas sp. Gutcm_11s]MDD0843370.1 hypothetical protein [Pseudomonas sp. Gutcm_11s]